MDPLKIVPGQIEWEAYWDPEGPIGYGKTKAKALSDLLDKCDDADGHAQDMLAGAIVAAVEDLEDRLAGDARVQAQRDELARENAALRNRLGPVVTARAIASSPPPSDGTPPLGPFGEVERVTCDTCGAQVLCGSFVPASKTVHTNSNGTPRVIAEAVFKALDGLPARGWVHGDTFLPANVLCDHAGKMGLLRTIEQAVAECTARGKL